MHLDSRNTLPTLENRLRARSVPTRATVHYPSTLSPSSTLNNGTLCLGGTDRNVRIVRYHQDGSEKSDPAQASPASGTESCTIRSERASEIGQILLVCERCFFSVGIPWFPPTKRTRELRKGCNESLNEFLQTALVTINTTQLELYLTDLESEEDSPKYSKTLGIEISSRAERYGFVFLFAAFAIGIAMLCGYVFGITPSAIFATTFIFAVLVSFLAERLSRDKSRRCSFAVLVQNELKRRRGLDNPTLTTLPLYTLLCRLG